MDTKWSDSVRDDGTKLPADVQQSLNEAHTIISAHRAQISKELEKPINQLLISAANHDLSKDIRKEIVGSISYLLSGVGLALGYPIFENNQKAAPGTPCSAVLKSSRSDSHWLVLRTRAKEGDPVHESPALTYKADKPILNLELVEHVFAGTSLNRGRATRSLGKSDSDRSP